jgi:phosphoglucosamine mutase
MEHADKLLLRSSPSEDTTPNTGLLLGRALAFENKKVVVGKDLVRSSHMMMNALIAGLVSSGVDVVDVGEVSEPVLAMAASMGDCAVYVTEFRQYDLVSGYLLINKDGSYFNKEQLRQLDRVFTSEPAPTDYKSLGTVRMYYNAVRDYNDSLLALVQGTNGGSMVLDCNCGMATDSAPQVLNRIGTDIISMNAQKDQNFFSNSMSIKETDIKHMRALVEANAGYIGISMNRIGTLLRVFDESGDPLTDEQVLALLILYLKPKCLVVPMDVSWFISDLFYGKFSIDVTTPYQDPDAEERRIIPTYPASGDVFQAMSGLDNALGYYDGGFITKGVSLNPDAIYASILLSQFAANNNIKGVVSKFPEYFSEQKSYKLTGNRGDFIRMMEQNIPNVSMMVKHIDDCWRADMPGGGFYVSLDSEHGDVVNVKAESGDKLYLLSLLEVIDSLIESCLSGQ